MKRWKAFGEVGEVGMKEGMNELDIAN